MLDGFTFLLSIIEAGDDHVCQEIKEAIESLPIGIKRAVQAERSDCSVTLKGEQYIYDKDYDGIMLGRGTEEEKPGDWELFLNYNDADMCLIEEDYKTIMAQFSKVLFVVKKDGEVEAEYNDYDFEITKHSIDKYTCNIYLTTRLSSYELVESFIVTLNLQKKKDVKTNEGDEGCLEEKPAEDESKKQPKPKKDDKTKE